MKQQERFIFAKALAETFSVDELKAMRKKTLTAGTEGRVTSWSDVGLSSSMTYEFNSAVAVDILSAAIAMCEGTFRHNKEKIRKFVL